MVIDYTVDAYNGSILFSHKNWPKLSGSAKDCISFNPLKRVYSFLTVKSASFKDGIFTFQSPKTGLFFSHFVC